MSEKFRKRVEAIFKDYEVEYYNERQFFEDAGRNWVEFRIRPEIGVDCAITYKHLRALAGILGTENISSVSWDLNHPGERCERCYPGAAMVCSIEARGVSFPKRGRK